MRKNERQIDESELLPFHIIQAASEGDVEAINVVLKHYEGYITSLSTRMLFDEYGQAYYCAMPFRYLFYFCSVKDIFSNDII